VTLPSASTDAAKRKTPAGLSTEAVCCSGFRDVDAAVAKNDQRQSAPRAPGDRRARFSVRSIFWESDNRFSGVPSRMIALHFECGAAVEKAARRSLIPHTRVAVRLY